MTDIASGLKTILIMILFSTHATFAAQKTNTKKGIKHLHGINELHDLGLNGEGIKIALVDTGVNKDHPRLRGKVIGCDADSTSFLQLSLTSSHGSHVAGIIAGESSNPFSDIGVAPKAMILSARRSKKEDWVRIIERTQRSDANIVNISWGLKREFYKRGLTQEERNSFINLAKSGKIIIKSADNGSSSSESPYISALYALAHEINSSKDIEGAMIIVMNAKRDQPYKLNPSSNRPEAQTQGSDFSLCAIGTNIRSTVRGNNFKEKTGTSMSAPYVTGVSALLLQAYPDLPPKIIALAVLKGATTPRDERPELGRGALSGIDSYNWLKQFAVDSKENIDLSKSDYIGYFLISTDQPQVETKTEEDSSTPRSEVIHTSIGYVASYIIGTSTVQGIGRILGYRY